MSDELESKGNQGDAMNEPTVMVPLSGFTKSIAREAAHEILEAQMQKHMTSCPAVNTVPTLTQRVERLEIKLSSLVYFMLGTGIFGGVSGSLLTKLVLK